MHAEIFPIHEKCKGCDHTRNEGVETFCKAYSNPSYWWEERNLVQVHKMLNPIKASKRFKK